MTWIWVLIVLGVVAGILLSIKYKDRPPTRLNSIPTEERTAQLEAHYQQRLKDEREQQPPTS